MISSQSTMNQQDLTERALSAVRDQVIRPSRDIIIDFLRYSQDQLIEYAQRPSVGDESFEYIHARTHIANNQNQIARTFLRHLDECFTAFARKEYGGADEFNPDEGANLTLVDQEELEEDIALISIRQSAESVFNELLWPLSQRLSLLNGGHKVTEAQLPMAPGRYCVAFKKALALAGIPLSVKLVLYKLFDHKVISQLSGIYEKANAVLIELKVLPNLRYQVEKSRGGDAARYTGAAPRQSSRVHSGFSDAEAVAEVLPSALPSDSLPPAEYQRQLLEGIRSLQERLSEPNNARVAQPGQAVEYSNDQLAVALDRLQQLEQVPAKDRQLTADSIMPLDVAIARDRLVGQIQHVLDTKENPVLAGDDMQTIDLVGMLFEYMLGDDQLPDSVKALLSYLHTPFLKVAFADKDFFRQKEHPARLLLNTLAEAGIRWVGNDGNSQFDMFERINQSVQRILDEFKSDVKLFAHLLMEFNSYTQKIELRVQLLEKRATEKARGEDRLRAVKQRVNKEIQNRIKDREVPSAILLFLLQPWSDYMAFLLLRYGSKSDSWAQANELIDDLLWGLELTDSDGDNLRWKQHYPWMESIIGKGFEAIGYEKGKAMKLKRAIDNVFQLREQKLKPAKTPDEIRDKLMRLAEKKAGQQVVVDQLESNEKAVVEKLREMEFGTWFEHRDGRREKVAWFNPQTLHFLFVDQTGKRSSMRTGDELAQAIVAEEIRMIVGNAKPLVERTMENIFTDLNQQLQAQEA